MTLFLLSIRISLLIFFYVYKNSGVPDNYKIIFMQGGGTGLFAAVAINLISRTGEADYFITGKFASNLFE